MKPALLDVEDLTVVHDGEHGSRVDLVAGVSFALRAGETLGLVGESGSGKSLTALAVMDLLGPNLAAGGTITLAGRELGGLSSRQRRRLCGTELAMVFQDPMTALNPVYCIGYQIAEVLLTHRLASRDQARARAVDLLRQVGIPDPAQRVDAYPHQLSGGMRQRVVIAIALAGDPSILIADEPTTALDVTVQAQILELLRSLRDQRGMGTILISHDLGAVAEIATHVMVMYAGQVVEHAPAADLFREPQHPYTIGLLGSLPKLGARERRLTTIGGRVPLPGTVKSGCRFAQRCPWVLETCRQKEPPLMEVAAGHRAACFRVPLPTGAPLGDRA
ncbi:peptide/nickel transport system ATP-binding protein [Bosea sp. BE271]|jgi:peptide/nickel transport system ATP-binding protein|uniref:Peptide ABC transporter ATP-binding protein n=1 Tax=Bosea thiooxidans TaxID=53254 RepID=A0A0Q3M6K1_9HYPH|nr:MULTISPECIES: ABC transporter ATP-binding protein [Bosea]KQK31417.1 peptide ABC transporter ATP-binding protein [Bosea thiooxidans]MDR6830579.1 peptide/nickel transport system ATP-binding protein [Bosea robiniae]MDR6897460.1 peptide/nickel transport system ATP-binding protein [Bosea sp. BE109]MDR7140857.1 peptide/nickel transport system ATP-binding protein [Bosea sp. BE168]MDR7177400.1 peptide/nickel transport system ATP-binding protein [Bosea sp. BE271]